MSLFDCWLSLDQDRKVLSINWQDRELELSWGAKWGTYVNQRLPDIFELRFDQPAGILKWNGERLNYKETVSPNGLRFLFFKREDRKQLLYEFALDELKDGVQIYGHDGRLIHLNQASRRISGIPGHLEVAGKHLMELYDLDPEISTVMTSLRTRRPVINRFDNFKSAEGSNIVSVNTAYPVFDNQELAGSVVFEQNLESIRDQIESLEERKNTIKKKSSLPVSRFSGYQFSDLIGNNRDLIVAIALAQKIAPQDCNLLLVGETGTGKEIFAQSIHKSSDRRNKKFVAINCAAVPDTLIESMFFGTSKGSFTGSLDRPGLLEEASAGVLFLDELNSMSLSMQSKLLRVIQEGSFRRLGGGRDIRTDIRFISSCNEDPSGLIERNILRKDLFYRLSTVTIDIPPLRDRMDDIEELVSFYLAKHIGGYLKTIAGVAPQVLELFHKYHWPGNVRELFNVLDYVLNTVDGDRIEVKHLPRHLAFFGESGSGLAGPLEFRPEAEGDGDGFDEVPSALHHDRCDLNGFLRNMEKRVIESALLKCRYNLTRTASSLNLSRQNLQYRIKKLGIEL